MNAMAAVSSYPTTKVAPPYVANLSRAAMIRRGIDTTVRIMTMTGRCLCGHVHLPDGSASSAKYNSADPSKGHDHTFFVQHSRDVFAD